MKNTIVQFDHKPQNWLILDVTQHCYKAVKINKRTLFTAPSSAKFHLKTRLTRVNQTLTAQYAAEWGYAK